MLLEAFKKSIKDVGDEEAERVRQKGIRMGRIRVKECVLTRGGTNQRMSLVTSGIGSADYSHQ